MTSEGLGEMFEGDTADMYAGKFALVSMGGRAEGLACADPGARTPIGASGILSIDMTECKVNPMCLACIVLCQINAYFDANPEVFVFGARFVFFL